MEAEWLELSKSSKPVQLEQVYGGRGKKGGTSDASRSVNISRQEAQRAEKISSLTPEAKEAGQDLRLGHIGLIPTQPDAVPVAPTVKKATDCRGLFGEAALTD
jgi:hypothetical protein